MKTEFLIQSQENYNKNKPHSYKYMNLNQEYNLF